MANSTPVIKLRNIGPTSAQMLSDAGLVDAEDLRVLGPVLCYLAVQQAGYRPSLNLLWAIEGALTERAWNAIPEVRKASLLIELREHTKAKRKHP